MKYKSAWYVGVALFLEAINLLSIFGSAILALDIQRTNIYFADELFSLPRTDQRVLCKGSSTKVPPLEKPADWHVIVGPFFGSLSVYLLKFMTNDNFIFVSPFLPSCFEPLNELTLIGVVIQMRMLVTIITLDLLVYFVHLCTRLIFSVSALILVAMRIIHLSCVSSFGLFRLNVITFGTKIKSLFFAFNRLYPQVQRLFSSIRCFESTFKGVCPKATDTTLNLFQLT